VWADKIHTPIKENNVANWITISRIPLLIVYILMLYFGGVTVRVVSIPLLFVFIMMDSLDGIIARRTGQASLTGSVLDIAADRIYELVLWFIFADLDLISIAIPLIVVIRTSLTDALRSIGVSQGEAPFEQHRSKIGRFIVGSPWMRGSYSVSKILSFCGLTLVVALRSFPIGSSAYQAAPLMHSIFQVTSWIAVSLCVIRGSPVIIGAIRRGYSSAGGES
jgi:phosphatidylglycerophosphate synthase